MEENQKQTQQSGCVVKLNRKPDREVLLQKADRMLLWVLLLLTALFVVFYEGYRCGSFSYYFGGDTEAYYIYFNHTGVIMPLYPIFFHVLQLVFGRELYLTAAAIIQMVFLILTIVGTVQCLRREFSLGPPATLVIWGCCMLPFAILLPEDPIGHTLMTESFTYPLFYLFVCSVLRGLRRGRRYFAAALGIAFASALVRSQMMFLFVVCGLFYVYAVIWRWDTVPASAQGMAEQEAGGENTGRECAGSSPLPFPLTENMNTERERAENSHSHRAFRWRKAAEVMLFGALTLFVMRSVTWLHAAYERFFFDAPYVAYSDQTLVQHMLYLSDEEDARLFQDPALREIFAETYRRSVRLGANHRFEEKGLEAWRKIVADCGSCSYTLGDVIEDYYVRHGGWPAEDGIAQEQLKAQISHALARPLLRVHFTDKLRETLRLMPSGFVSTMLFHKESVYGLIHLATALLYLSGFAGAAILSARDTSGEGERSDCEKGEQKKFGGQDAGPVTVSEMVMLTFLLSIVNVTACNLIHFGLQRYLAYTLGFNWAALFLLLREFRSRAGGKN